MEERENRQEQRTQKRNLHRENISQKKQELQKAQEARQTVHANGSATAGATRSHERPVATPVPKPAQTDMGTKPDMKRPATSPVIKNAEVKAGKEHFLIFLYCYISSFLCRIRRQMIKINCMIENGT